jgi:CubicO group peptidase (beta-lactamase class C family)
MKQVDSEKIDRLFECFTIGGSPGCALGVTHNGGLIFKKGYGLANLEYGIPIEPSTIFHVASMSKQFTAMAVTMLASWDKLRFEDNIRDYLPEVPDFGHPITIGQLMHHTSGLRSDLILLILAGYRLEDLIANNDVMELIAGQRDLNFKPGEKFSYCGSGYLLLALLVERVSGNLLNGFCLEHIFKPLGMLNTHFHDDPLKLVQDRAYAYYAIETGEYQNAILTCGLTGGTGLYTSIEDLARWDENFYSARVGGTAVIERMHQPACLNDGREIEYAAGLILENYKGKETVVHGGDGAGIHCYMIRFPKHRFSVVVLGNRSDVNARRLAHQVVDIYLFDPEEDVPEKTLPEMIELEEEQLATKAGRYFDPDSTTFIDVECTDGRLRLWGHELLPRTERSFFFASFPEATVDFEPAIESEPAVVSVDTGTTMNRYLLVDPTKLVPASLSDFVGTYFSPELGVSWAISEVGEELVVRRRKQGSSILKPVIADVFIDDWVASILHGVSKPMALAFDRDERDIVTGFRISDAAGRVLNLRFERKNAQSALFSSG